MSRATQCTNDWNPPQMRLSSLVRRTSLARRRSQPPGGRRLGNTARDLSLTTGISVTRRFREKRLSLCRPSFAENSGEIFPSCVRFMLCMRPA